MRATRQAARVDGVVLATARLEKQRMYTERWGNETGRRWSRGTPFRGRFGCDTQEAPSEWR